MPNQATETSHRELRISDNAAKRIVRLVAQEGEPELALRVAVSGGGCSGFQYGFSLDNARRPDDLLFQRNGASVIVDEVSFELLQGAELDYVQDLVGSYFAVKNPNATSTCGCGSSFAI
jgi:iron-sulfur cluster insertion protein